MTTREQVESFHHFALERLSRTDHEASLDDLYRIWRARTPNRDEFDESVAAVKAACADLDAGESGCPARASLDEACRELGLVIDG